MPVFLRSSSMPVSVEALSDWHFRVGAIDRLIPGFEEAEIVQRPGALAEGAIASFRVRKYGLWMKWRARHHDVQPGVGFSDTQESGPFSRWEHQHRFLAEGPNASLLEDRIDYELPGGALGRLFAGAGASRDLERMFHWRHARTRHDLHHHRPFGTEHLRVAVSGGNGMVGGALVPFLTTGGHDVRRIVRGAADHSQGEIAWDQRANTFDAAALEGLDAVVHLAGAGIADARWSAERKALIRSSRVDSTAALARTLAGLRAKPRVLVCASAIGIYGDRSAEDPVDESSPAGEGFLAETCTAWERAADPARAAGIRVVHVRIGLVLSARGGVLAKLLTPFKLGLGGAVGSGQQGMSWIDLDDLLGIVRFVLSAPLSGAVNAVAPEALSNRDFAKVLGGVLARPAVAPLPATAVRALLGQMGQELLLEGAYVRPTQLQRAGFEWALPDLEHALRFETGRMQ